MDGKQLKNSILQWAIQGKLVPQNPKDESAQKLLERIAASRNESSLSLPKGTSSTSLRGPCKETKQSKNPTSRIYRENDVWYEQVGTATPKDITDEIPFEIPETWAWCRFNSICDIARGGSPRPIQNYLTDSPEGYNWIKIGDTEKGGKYINSTKERIKPEGLTKTRLIHKGDFLLTNSMSFGRPYISNIDGCIHDGWLVMSILGNAFVPDYLYYLLSSPYAYHQFCGRVAGAVVKNLNIDKVAESLIPLPPLAEQKRIVAKLEQVLPLAEEYGAAQEQLDKLNKELPEALKKSILQEAIQGKLVPQNPKDEPAQNLLERITVARSESSQPKGAKSKKSTPTSRIYCENGTWYEQIGNAEPKDISDEIPFDIPTSWVWCRFNSICDIARGGSPRPIQDYLTDSPEGYNWIKIGDTEKGGKYINSTKERIKPEGLTKTRLIHKGDFLLTNSMSFGRPYISNIDGCIHDGWLVISILGNAFVPDYLYYLLSSQYAYRQFCGRVAGAVVKNLNIDKVAESLIPLPPLAEQKRIVAKLEQLFKVL